jgi:chemotaxis protein methyltransferase CheR
VTVSNSIPTPVGIRPLRDREFTAFQELIYQEAGIYLSKVKQALLVGRLSRRVRELGLDSFAAYYERVVDPRYPEERVELINCICTHETHFFREPRQFEYLENVALPKWRAQAEAGGRAKRVRAWSAGCSSGEEPFSIAMSLLAACPPTAGWTVEVVATDVSTRVLERARAATWPLDRSKHIPDAYLKRFMLRGHGEHEKKMKAGPELRDAVRFEHLNLNDGSYQLAGAFDLVFCRNVLIYFDANSKERVIRNLLDRLSPDGLLFLGHAETLSGFQPEQGGAPRAVMPTIYSRGAR